MVQIQVESGRKAGASWVARRFPIRIGRSASADLQLEEGGVWDQHLQLQCDANRGIILQTQPQALTTVNGQPVQEAVLRNGDTIELGSAKLRFGLSPTRQRGLRFREVLTWACIAAVSVGQVALVYLLLR